MFAGLQISVTFPLKYKVNHKTCQIVSDAVKRIQEEAIQSLDPVRAFRLIYLSDEEFKLFVLKMLDNNLE
jgi:hypothetical protein